MLTPMLAQILIALSVTFLWLYLNGNEYTTITGRLVASVVDQHRRCGNRSRPVETAYYLHADDDERHQCRGKKRRSQTTNAIDLSAVSKVKVTLSGYLTREMERADKPRLSAHLLIRGKHRERELAQ